MAQVRRRAHSSDRAGRSNSLEREVGGRPRPVSLIRDDNERDTARARPASLVRTMSMHVDDALAGEIFDHFCNAGTLKSILRSYRYLCEVLRLKPNQFPYFYPKLKAKLKTWKAQALWAKFDKRASHKCYNRGKSCEGKRVMVIGAGPCGLRTAIEAQLLGAKVVIVEKRDRYSRNNVLHLWPYNIHDLRALGAKKFYGKFCAGSIDHISIRQLQCILIKVCLLLGVEVFENVSFEGLIEPVDVETGWRAKFIPDDHPLGQFEFDVIVAADGRRNTIPGFKRKELRGKLAIAITANFINRHTEAENHVEEIAGLAFIYNQKFFHDLSEALGIELENVLYYKDETHYFVMTAKKKSLLSKGVLLQNHTETSLLLSSENINQEALFQYAREAADFATNGQLPHLDFAVNHYGKPDVAMFDFTSMYQADHSSRVTERHGHRLLSCLVGDSLLEPFWPTGTGCPRGFFGGFDAMWLMKQLDTGKMSVLECLAERESIYRMLSQTKPENTCKDYSNYTLDPATRYPNANLRQVLPFQVMQLFDTDNPAQREPHTILQDAAAAAPRKRRRKDSHVNPITLLAWLQKQVDGYPGVEITDMTTSFQNGLALCAIIHHYRPDLIDFASLDKEDIVFNNQLALDIMEGELGIPPMTTGQEVANNVAAGRPPDKLAMISYLAQVYDTFRKEIPYVLQPDEDSVMDDLDDSVYCHNHVKTIKAEMGKRAEKRARNVRNIGQLVACLARDKNKKSNDVKEAAKWELENNIQKEELRSNNRVSNKKRLAKLMERAALSEVRRKVKMEPSSIKNEERYKVIEQQFLGGPRRKSAGRHKDKKPRDLKRAIGKIDTEQVRSMETKLKETKKGDLEKKKVPKWSKEAFNDKVSMMKNKLEMRDDESRGSHPIDVSLAKLQNKLREGSTMETGERGANKVSALVGELASKLEPGRIEPAMPVRQEPVAVWVPPAPATGPGKGSDRCHFCSERVYVVERMSTEGKFFHRACFRCDYCNILLRLGSYVYHREGRFAGKFFCIPHSTENALEKYKFKKKVDEIHAAESLRKKIVLAEKSLAEKDRLKTTSMSQNNWLVEGRGTTPERVEYEASLDLYSEEEGLGVIDEDEWTDRNFGNSTIDSNGNTSDDSISDLDSDDNEVEEAEKPLTADETRKLAREWRARYNADQSDGDDSEYGSKGGREVTYTDQEYESMSSSDCGDVVLEVPVLSPSSGIRRRICGEEKGYSSDGDSSELSGMSSSSTESDVSLDIVSENNENPFHLIEIPQIVIVSNSPVMTSTPKQSLSPIHSTSGPPTNHYTPATIQVGRTPPGTALYQSSSFAGQPIASLTRYQFKTPALPNTAPQPILGRQVASARSNNLKKNWVTTSSGPVQSQKREDNGEINARLKSLMDRLSSQQSLLKPAEKPSTEMQHMLDNSGFIGSQRKLSGNHENIMCQLSQSVYTKKQIPPSLSHSYGDFKCRSNSHSDISSVSRAKPIEEMAETVPTSDLAVDESISKSDAMVEQREDGVTIQVPVQTARVESDSSSYDTSIDGSTTKSWTTEVSDAEAVEHELPEITINLAEPENDDDLDLKQENDCHGNTIDANKEEVEVKTPLKTIILIKSETADYNDSSDKANTCDSEHLSKECEKEISTPKITDNAMPQDSLNERQIGNTSTALNITELSIGLNGSKHSNLSTDTESQAIFSSEVEDTSYNHNPDVSSSLSLNGQEMQNGETDECGNLLMVCNNAVPQRTGENESSTDPVEVNGDMKLIETYKLTNANEKIASLNTHQQQQSNIIHDLIIGRTRQRRVRQPRVTVPLSRVPQIPSNITSQAVQLETMADLKMIDEDEDSVSQSLRAERRARESSPRLSVSPAKISLPPTPITNPEKFGIKTNKKEEERYKKEPIFIKSSEVITSPISPTASTESNDTDNLDGIISTDSSKQNSPTKSKGTTSSTASPGPISPVSFGSGGQSKKSRGFMAAVAGMFRSASPAQGKPSPPGAILRREESFLGRWSRKDIVKNKKEDGKELITRTASLSLQASHPSTPPIPLSRKIKLGEQPPQASEDSFSEEEDEEFVISTLSSAGSSGLPTQVLERLATRGGKAGKRAARQAGLARIRRAQEIQRELEEIEVECGNIEERGVELEQRLRSAGDGEEQLLGQWYKLLGEKNRIVRREQELMVGCKQLELEDRAIQLEAELARGEGGEREGQVLEELVHLADQRELLSAMLAKDQERYKKEDRDLEQKMAEQGIRITPIIAPTHHQDTLNLV